MEGIIAEEEIDLAEEDSRKPESFTPTQPMLSQYLEQCAKEAAPAKEGTPPIAIDEILGPKQQSPGAGQAAEAKVGNVEAISNSSSPFENEKIKNKIETQQN